MVDRIDQTGEGEVVMDLFEVRRVPGNQTRSGSDCCSSYSQSLAGPWASRSWIVDPEVFQCALSCHLGVYPGCFERHWDEREFRLQIIKPEIQMIGF